MIYFIRSGDAVKIGHSMDPGARVPTLRTANPNMLVVLGVMEGGAYEERRLHHRFRKHRINRNHEWFILCEEIVAFIEANARPYLHGLRKVGHLPARETAWKCHMDPLAVPFAFTYSISIISLWATYFLGSPAYAGGWGSYVVTAAMAMPMTICGLGLAASISDFVGRVWAHREYRELERILREAGV